MEKSEKDWLASGRITILEFAGASVLALIALIICYPPIWVISLAYIVIQCVLIALGVLLFFKTDNKVIWPAFIICLLDVAILANVAYVMFFSVGVIGWAAWVIGGVCALAGVLAIIAWVFLGIVLLKRYIRSDEVLAENQEQSIEEIQQKEEK